MGIFDELFAKADTRAELWARAERVGDAEEVMEMGILAAQLGLLPGDLEKMTRVYFMLQGFDNSQQFAIERTMRAIRIANGDS